MSTARTFPQIEEARRLSAEAFRFLKKIEKDELESDDDSGHMGRALQLVLQYRLDTQDMLLKLLHIERMVLSRLGIEPMAGSSLNIERISYALGKEDLKSLLYNLSQLVDRLLKVTQVQRRNLDFYQTHQKILSQHAGKHPKYIHDLNHAYQKQRESLEQVKSLECELQYLEKHEAKGPVLDHIAALEGPINKFYQATLNGLEYAFSLYHLMEKKYCVIETILHTVKRAEKLLHQIEAKQNLQQHQPAPTPQETLEERARKKRLRPFFSGL